MIAADGTIRGEALKTHAMETFTIIAENENGQSEATIRITVNDNVCEEDVDWYATYINMEVKNKCSIGFAEEVRRCMLDETSMQAVWSEVDGQCTMILIVAIAVAVVAVLALVIVLIVVIRK